ncbi:uncharacterized protein LOC127793598 [Diospyros lotus]|uniref:uncharacterized protein LOC127793598 n=1 Tax=Diospyros lotus TaxID=55363 RepID=UPI00224DF739|nr:uncharacterized protein LOC127793598 [Diospyros lotus]
MAVDFRERGSLLPSELLDDHDLLLDSRSNGPTTELISDGFSSTVFSSSGLSSPFGSELSSTETESEVEDDDSFLAELTRQMADYMLKEDDEIASENLKNSFGRMPVSPEHRFSGSECMLNTQTSVPVPGYQAFAGDQARSFQFYKVENQPSIERQGYGSWGKQVKGTDMRKQHGSAPPPPPWPPLQQRRQQLKPQVGSGWGMKAVFLRKPGSRSGPGGTGVFLPRGSGEPTEVRKKPGCSTVLIPTRVLQTLQLHHQDMINRSPPNHGGGFSAEDVATKSPDPPRPEPTNHHETGLPHEWTY